MNICIRKTTLFICILLQTLALTFTSARSQPLVVGSKHFTEGYILSEICALVLENAGFEVTRKYNLGGTMICYSALREGSIDLYPEYTGTIASEILKDPTLMEAGIRSQLDGYALAMSPPFGFNNTYAIVISEEQAKAKNIETIEDLRKHPELIIGLSYEFLKRQDGWENLSSKYNLPQSATGVEHSLAYAALSQGKIDVTDAYSTDGELVRYKLRILKDNRNFFPVYKAIAIYKTTLPKEAVAALSTLTGRINENEMQQMNETVLSGRKTYQQVAAEFILQNGLGVPRSAEWNYFGEIAKKSLTHLALTFLALFLAILVAVPCGMLIYQNEKITKPVTYLIGLLQTIPSIALLAFMIPFTGIGVTPAVFALFLYALLPILRSTVAGLKSTDPMIRNVAEGMGMTPRQQLILIDLPLATPLILSGIRTAAVINVGTATLAAFIGAGGIGEFIVTGLALNNTELILKGAIPAALMAIILELLFEFMERLLAPAYLKSGR